MDSGSLLFFNIPYVFALCIIFLTTGVNGGLSTSNTSHTINEVHSPRRYLKSNAQPTALAKGKRVALLQVHFEGNVGDQMETIPLLQKLNEWGVEVDCYLSVWMSQENRLDPHVKERG
jgi:UDP-glucose 6-dehydrogenase